MRDYLFFRVMKNEVSKIVGQNIKDIIKSKNLKVRIVASNANMDVETFRKYQNAVMEMGIEKAVRIAKALEVEVGELFKGV